MRIIGGTHRGRIIMTPINESIRPTGSRVREALFNILTHNNFSDKLGKAFYLKDARVLDLFAGTGALGLEALSRGASFALFVDNNKKALEAMRKSIEIFGFTSNTKIYKNNATKLGLFPSSLGLRFSLLFADPPYLKELADLALTSAYEGKWLSPNVLCIVEESIKYKFIAPPGFIEFNRWQYGCTKIIFLMLS